MRNHHIHQVRTKDDYYLESKRLKKEALEQSEALKSVPLRFTVTNGITMNVEITKSDIRTIVSKSTRDNKFNAIKNALAKDIQGYLRKARYLGWRPVIAGKHQECAYFTYYSRDLGAHTILCMRKMSDTNIYKPYAIIDKKMFDKEIKSLNKGTPF